IYGTVIVVDKEGNIVENKTSDSQNNGVTTASAQTSSTNEDSDSTQDDEKGTETGTTNNGNGSSNSNSGQTGTSASSNSSSNTGSTGSNSNTNPSTNTNTGGSNKPAEKVTVASIKSKYEGTFKSLENQSRARINSLISQAANEYSTKKSNGESIS